MIAIGYPLCPCFTQESRSTEWTFTLDVATYLVIWCVKSSVLRMQCDAHQTDNNIVCYSRQSETP